MYERNTPEYWRERTEEALADDFAAKDPEAKRIMERIAANYRNLADMIEAMRKKSIPE